LSGANTGTLPSGFVQIQAANPDLKWETTKEVNAGIDFAILHDKISGSFDYFSRNTTGILITPGARASQIYRPTMQTRVLISLHSVTPTLIGGHLNLMFAM